MKWLPNIITILRIPFSIAMLVFPPFSMFFWIFYIGSGVSDVVDGFLARALHQESVFGAKLDSIADSVFAGCLAIVVVTNIKISLWLWLCILGIALLRFISYGIGFHKYHVFASLHTWGNKVTGILLFTAPILYSMCGVIFTGIILCTVAFFSAVEELVITIKSRELDRDCKGIKHFP